MATNHPPSGDLEHVMETIKQLVQLDRNGRERIAQAEQQAEGILASADAEIIALEERLHSSMEDSLAQRAERLRETSESAILNAELRFSKAQQVLNERFYRHNEQWIAELVRRVTTVDEEDSR